MPVTQWLSPRERESWIRFAAVVELVPGLLDSQLQRDEGLTHFDYFALAMLSEADDRTLRMSVLASRTSATLPRLSRVIGRLEEQGFVERRACAGDRRATDVVLTERGWAKVVQSAPGHVQTVRGLLDVLEPEQVDALGDICARLLGRLDPEGRMFARDVPAADSSAS